ncbi:hypothetical protein [Chitinophaga sp.]|uniref:hypothetical protein n=1 Tax=Chitinophaga sp. TaxID=1869181 RepID=UPI00261BE674|nr:hypothetical protein [uncultured Chitinophaga sp.]
MKTACTCAAILVAALACPRLAAQHLSDDDLKKANNPLANAKSFNLHEYYAPSIYEAPDVRGNSLLIRFAMPLAKGTILLRATQPVSTVYTGENAAGKQTYASGLGDLSFFATYTLSKATAKWLVGLGPQFVFPTATRQQAGAGKVQAGAALILFNVHQPALQWGGLITYQHSIAGQSDRNDAQLLVVQPIGIFQLGKGAYLRTSGVMNFDLENQVYVVPVGFGAGHVVKVGKTVFNVFLEPQLTVLHYGPGQPSFQLFAGMNAQF